jgi:hypothetical protein
VEVEHPARRRGLEGAELKPPGRIADDDELDEPVSEVTHPVKQHERSHQTDDSLWPIFSFLVFKYRRVESCAGISSGIHSLTERP